MSVPSGFHLGYRDGHGASFYIQICPLSSNKLLGELESTPSSVISLQQNFTTMAFITGQNGSDGEFFLDSFLGKKEKKRKNLYPFPLNYTHLLSVSPAYQGLSCPRAFADTVPSPCNTTPPAIWRIHAHPWNIGSRVASSSLFVGINPTLTYLFSPTSFFISLITYNTASVTVLLVCLLAICSFPSPCETVRSVRAGASPLWFTTGSTSGTWRGTCCTVCAPLISTKCVREGPRQESQRRASGECCWFVRVANLVA